ncbi:MAG: phosphatidate cytidylyltransferase [Candidatus Cloacimonetes bacterium]|nr:phosphatidate cytidylyltransferase [Candidatus Cloacimonadota bacterium]
MTELPKRVLVSALLIPLILAALWFGGPWLIVFFAAAVVLASGEYIAMLRHVKIRPPWHWIAVALAVYAQVVLIPGYELLSLWGVLLIAWLEVLLRWDPQTSVPLAALEVLGVLYAGLLPALCVRLGLQGQRPSLLLLLVVLIWIADSLAYLVGTKWGKRRNIVAISPNKSLEGFLAGALAPIAIVIILYFVKLYNDLPVLLLAAFAAGVVGQLGDLAESALKRFCQVKDSSNLIPGHGGILDRSDSIILAGSFLYCAMTILQQVR